jgi:ribonuclease D
MNDEIEAKLRDLVPHLFDEPTSPQNPVEELPPHVFPGERHEVEFAGEVTPFYWVNTPHELAWARATLEGSHRLYLDTEFESYRGGCTLALIQVSDGRNLFVIDALELAREPALKELLSEAQEWVAHDATFDVRLICEALEIPPPRLIFDTQVAWAFYGGGIQAPLSELCERFGHTADKRYQSARFLERPLPYELITYAALDVPPLIAFYKHVAPHLAQYRLLEGVYEHSHDRLSYLAMLRARYQGSSQGSSQESKEGEMNAQHTSFEVAEGPAYYDYETLMSDSPPSLERLLKITPEVKRRKKLSKKADLLFCALTSWRQAENAYLKSEVGARASLVMMPKPKQLAAIAQLAPTNLEQLKGLQGLDNRWVVRYGERALRLIARYSELSSSRTREEYEALQLKEVEGIEGGEGVEEIDYAQEGGCDESQPSAQQSAPQRPTPQEVTVYKAWLTYQVSLLSAYTKVHTHMILHPQYINRLPIKRHPESPTALIKALSPFQKGWRSQGLLPLLYQLAERTPLPFLSLV